MYTQPHAHTAIHLSAIVVAVILLLILLSPEDASWTTLSPARLSQFYKLQIWSAYSIGAGEHGEEKLLEKDSCHYSAAAMQTRQVKAQCPTLRAALVPCQRQHHQWGTGSAAISPRNETGLSSNRSANIRWIGRLFQVPPCPNFAPNQHCFKKWLWILARLQLALHRTGDRHSFTCLPEQSSTYTHPQVVSWTEQQKRRKCKAKLQLKYFFFSRATWSNTA